MLLKKLKRIFKNDFSQKEDDLSKQWENIILNSDISFNDFDNDDSKKILFVTSYGHTKYLNGIETVLGSCLKVRGHQPHYMICDYTLPACEWNKWGNMNFDLSKFAPEHDDPYYTKYSCDVCVSEITNALEQLPFPLIKLSSFDKNQFDSDNLANLSFSEMRNYVYNDIAVGQQAFASVIRSLMVAHITENEYTKWLLKRYLFASINIVNYATEIIKNLSPDRIIMPHGVYVTHGTILMVAEKFKIPTFVHGRNYRKKTLTIVKDQSYHTFFHNLDKKHWNIGLSQNQETLIKDYLASRVQGSKDRTSYHKKSQLNEKDIIKDHNIDLNKPIVTLFTNIAWDAQIVYKSNYFDNMTSWVFDNIDYYSKKNNIQLVIRIHPSESRGLGTNQPLYKEIISKYKSLPDNIIIIKSESKTNSYKLADMSNASLVYASKIGLEIVSRGIPVVLGGEAFYRDKGFTYDINSLHDFKYFNDNILKLGENTNEKINMALRFAYYFFYRSTLDFPLLSDTSLHDNNNPKLNFNNLEDLTPKNNYDVDHICNAIINDIEPSFLVQ